MRIISRVGIGKNPTSHHLDVTGSVNVDGQAFFQNNVFLNANVDLGNASSDLIAFNGRSITSIIPNSNQVLDFGSTSLFWQNTYTKNLIIKNTGSIESDGGILNIGTNSATSINIGNSSCAVNFFGSINSIQSTDLEIFDKLITINKNSAASSGFESGLEIEENLIKTGYIKTSTDRNKWTFKAPNISGTISLQPGNSSADLTILSSASGDITWTIPDTTDTFVGISSSQIVSNKTLNNTQVTGDFTITGRAIGVGFIPIGGVIAIMPHLSGAYNCSATTAADSYGFVRCGFSGQSGNQVIADATSPLNGQTIPRINNDVFLMGNVTSATAASSSNSRTLLSNNLPAHQHSIDHNHSAQATSSTTPDIQHTHGVGIGGTDINHQHNYYEEGLDEIDNSWRGGGSASGPYAVYKRGRDRTTGWMNQNWAHSHSAWTGGISVNNSGHTHSVDLDNFSGNSGNGPGTSTSFDIRPSYIQAVYIMRIK